MDVGIGLPNAVAGTTGKQLVDFARQAEQHDFSVLGTIDRLIYPNYDPFIALAAAAAVTERIPLATTILIVPYRVNGALVAKQAASVHELSDGRLWLGVAIGARDDDYEATGVSTENKGGRLDEMLDEMRAVWSGEERGHAGAIGPLGHGAPPLIVGGTVDAAFRRVARVGEGWIMGGGAPDQFAEAAAAVREAWKEAGRDGEPKLKSLAYYSLGPDAEENARNSIGSYYAWLGEIGDQIVASAAKDPETVRQYMAAFEEAGCGELIFFPASGDPEQVRLLAEARDG